MVRKSCHVINVESSKMGCSSFNQKFQYSLSKIEWNGKSEGPMSRTMQLHYIFLSRRFHRPIYFWMEFPWNETPVEVP